MKSIKVIADTYALLVTSDVKGHQDYLRPPEPIWLTPDLDVELSIPMEDETVCIHARRLELAGGGVETVRCKGKPSKTSPNGLLCDYHQRYLNPKVAVRPTVPYKRPDSQVDLNKILPDIRREVREARTQCADNEIHDFLLFERLKDVVVDEAMMRKYLNRQAH